MEKTAEEFLREKLESEIGSFGDGTTEFHTRDIEHLLKCLYDKDNQIIELIEKIKPSFKFTSPAPNESNQNQFDLSEKFEDWYYEKEYEHLKNGTEFKPNEMFEFLKPHLKVSK